MSHNLPRELRVNCTNSSCPEFFYTSCLTNLVMNSNETSKILIAYFSYSGNTQEIALKINEMVGGVLFRIEPAKKYPESYQDVLKVGKDEIIRKYRPPLKKKLENIEKFDVIFIGSPNWCKTIAPPVVTFLSVHSFSGKRVIPFISHGGGGKDSCVTDLKKMIPKATVLEAIVVYGNHIETISRKMLKL